MKKISLITIIGTLLFSESLNYYLFSVKENYKEYSYGNVIDRDYNSFGDMLGIGIKYTKDYYYSNIYLLMEFAYGTSIYDGAYQDGTPVKIKEYDVGIFNFKAGINTKFYLLELGYRFWNRGSSNTPGDYNEQYYWPYLGFGFERNLRFNSYTFSYSLKYNYAFWPRLKVYLGNEPTIKLGNTNGYEFQFSLQKQFDFTYSAGIFYRFNYWHINRSKNTTLILNGNEYQIYEPESKTRNQYIGIYLQKSF